MGRDPERGVGEIADTLAINKRRLPLVLFWKPLDKVEGEGYCEREFPKKVQSPVVARTARQVHTQLYLAISASPGSL